MQNVKRKMQNLKFQIWDFGFEMKKRKPGAVLGIQHSEPSIQDFINHKS